MITYDYAMFATGHNWRFELPYSTLAEKFAIDKNKYNKSKIFLTTTDDVQDIKNLSVYKVPENYPLFFRNAEEKRTSDFNFNIKFLALRNAMKNSMSEYIIYFDSDFMFSDSYEEWKVQGLLEQCQKQQYDIFAPRFSFGHRDAYEHKYDTLGIDREDPIPTFQEGYIIFRNTYKLKHFIEKWEELYWKMQQNNIQQVSEGLEIGIAARYADFHHPDDFESTYYLFKDYLYGIFWTMTDKDKKVNFIDA